MGKDSLYQLPNPLLATFFAALFTDFVAFDLPYFFLVNQRNQIRTSGFERVMLLSWNLDTM